MSVKTVKIGVSGFGSGRGGGMVHLGAMLTGGAMETVAAYEPNDEHYERGCRLFECRPKRYPSVQAMVKEAQPDGVIIASPNAFHYDNLRELDGARCAVLLEKPLDASWKNICAVVRFVSNYPGPVVVGHCLRYAPILCRAKALIMQGAVGRVRSARFVQNCYYGNGMFHNWRRERRHSGTMMIEKATHDIDVMQWLVAARPTEVYASLKLQAFGGDKPADLTCNRCDERLTCPESAWAMHARNKRGYGHVQGGLPCCFSSAVDVPDDETCIIQFDSGVHATYIATYYTPASFYHRNYQLVGDRGCMEIDLGAEDGESRLRVFPRYGSAQDVAEERFDAMGRAHHEGDRFLALHFYDVMANNAKPCSTVEQAFLAEALGYSAVLSSDEKRPVAIASIVPDDLKPLFGSAVVG